MTVDYVKQAEERMEKSVAALKRDFATVRAGRATPSLLDKVMVEYYGSLVPISQMANISVPDSRTLLIQPWDKSSLSDIERSIMKSDLGLSPSNDGVVIRLILPQLTEQRRVELTKVIRKLAEEGRVAVRNVRRDVNDDVKKAEKQSLLPEDESRRLQEKIQDVTDKTVAEIDRLLAQKERELLEV
ncbi:ribosome recycling factor [Ferroacidibacillus organovorans]|uniref:Ribosome-recycling factor n=1 Tax=Ferroacidibacillus organovorans TaxID=1765683 RepID=A0A162UWX6_9BACL|nr:ribosome recycling factor [Ferroacidibacillus organovorans]KYP82103.1 ribosome recycling factor [Ferroacidibacillus organovorans]OAG94463.1 ribosome recycling factor [Ferroacidibacillus organovorans]OPG15653.1 ribosome recycling factor [Ferroacidibacillus organovorans]